MKKTDLARRLARQGQITQAEAADQLDRVVHDILRKLRKGQAATLPGLGTLTPGRSPQFHLEPHRAKPSARKRKS